MKVNEKNVLRMIKYLRNQYPFIKITLNLDELHKYMQEQENLPA